MNKFHAVRTKTPDGIGHDSQKEARRWAELKLLERAGEITNLERKPVFKFSVGDRPVLIRSPGFPNGRQAKYTADAAYFCKRRNCRIVEDTKGGHATATEAYKLRKALVEAMYPGTVITEVST